MCLACFVPGPVPSAAGAAPFPGAAEPFPWPDGRRDGGTISWTGVAGFVFAAAGARIAFDPFVSRPGLSATLFRPARPDEALVRATFGDLDAVFVGHTHYDHAMDLPAVARASPRAVLHGSRTTVEVCRRLGVPPERLAVVEDGSRVRVGPFAVETVGSAHGRVPLVGLVDRRDLPQGRGPGTPFRWPRGPVLAWRVEALGRSFHVQGSAGIDDHPLERQAPADALVACLAARRGTPRYLERLGERLRPRVLVPCHHDDFFRPLGEPPRPIPTLRWAAFLREAAALEHRHGTRLWLPARGAAAAW